MCIIGTGRDRPLKGDFFRRDSELLSVLICFLAFDTPLQVLESQVHGAGSQKCQYRWTDALQVLWRAKALLQGTAGDYLYTENQIIHIPCSVIKSHSWLGEIPTTTFLPPLERMEANDYSVTLHYHSVWYKLART